jgi:hypothetical protein
MTNTEVNRILAEYMGFKYKQLAGIAYEGFWVDTNKHNSEDTNTLLGALHFNRDGFKLSRELNYTSDLNSLIPVWERLKLKMGHFSSYKNYSDYGFQIRPDELEFGSHSTAKTIQEAAAHATAKAILALNKKEKNEQ